MFEGGGIGGKGRRGEKEWGKGVEGLEGEDFPGKFGKPPDRQIRQGPLSPKSRDRHPFGGDHLPPPSPLLTPICVSLSVFYPNISFLLKHK